MFSKFLQSDYWFSQPPIFFTSGDWKLVYVFGGLIVIAAVFRFFAATRNPVQSKVFRQVWYLGLTVGLIGLLLSAFRYENIPMLSIRFWPGLTLLSGCIWLLFIAKYLIFKYRKDTAAYEREMVKNKYIPGSGR